ncbi:hypothetical protein J2S74_004030 [Evansella vedderi]|uniref:DUF3906 domain-containing protein n=1 Tax=Evansella vedderi TaxID=38282 RepID=A0ABT9ZZD4_9BACI|nr:DUF3906 family protein [Evansella vedderi]MDQ0256608.1 hypothetical protein [Evansella vedderi]
MQIYRFEGIINETKKVTVIVAAKDDDAAFDRAEIEIESNYLKKPVIEELTLLEKKKLTSGGGFVIEGTEGRD